MTFKHMNLYRFGKKSGIILALVIITISQNLLAQNLDANRTSGTIIADLLNRFPAENSAAFNRAMTEMSNMEVEDLTSMALMLSENGNNEKLEYALSGFSFFASQQEKSEEEEKVVQAYGKALTQIKYDEGKAFLIENLRIIGNDEAVPFLAEYLKEERLASPAARALASIGSQASENALIGALKNPGADEILISIIEALGDTKSKAASSLIESHILSENPRIRKVAIYSLARIGSPSSERYLADAAEAANYKYEETNAASEFLNYAQNLADDGETKKALSIAKKIHKKTKENDQYHTKIGALKLMVDLDPNKFSKLILKAAVSENSAYRNAALSIAAESDLKSNLGAWTKKLENAGEPVQLDFIRTLGRLEGEEVLEALRPYLQSHSSAIKQQAISSAVLVGENKVLPDLLGMINSSDKDELEVIKQGLLTMKGNNISDEVAKVLPEMSDQAKIVLLQVLASRPSPDHMAIVLKEVNSSNTEVKNAALSSLSRIAAPNHLDQLVSLLKAHQNPEELKLIQQAIIAANSQVASKTKQTEWALQTLETLPAEKKVYLYEVLAHTGGTAALANLKDIYQKGNSDQKKSSLAAIANWPDAEAINVLYQIAGEDSNQENSNKALQGFIQLIRLSSHKAEGKVILLRKALDHARNKENKQLALRELANSPTLQALIVSGKYLDDSDVQQQAARTVMTIALADTSLYGVEVRSILEKTKEVISGPDSEYYKTSLQKRLDEMPKGKGFYSIFNGQNLDGWMGSVANPIKRGEMSPETLAKAQEKANQEVPQGWEVQDGLLVFTGKGNNLVTERKFGNFEMFVDWKITEEGDAGIYLRGTPQVQIWDVARVDVGAEVGSGGLYNNQNNPSKPLKVADNPVGEWNTFHIKMQGDKVTVYLNGELVTDNVSLENYWDPSMPLFPEEHIELQAHGTYVAYRDLYIKELPGSETFQLSEEEKSGGYEVLFGGENLDQWTGNTTDYVIENGEIVIYPDRGGEGNLFTKKEFGDFEFRFEFKLTPGANNGLGIRSPLEGDAAYVGMELQILDNTADIYKNLEEYQFHGSLYGIAAAKKGHLKPVGEWNYQEVRVEGDKIQVRLNGEQILDADISEAKVKGTKDGRDHPGLKRSSGHIGFLGHGDVVFFRNIRIKEL